MNMVVFYDMNQDEVKDYPNFHLSLEITANLFHLLLIDTINGRAIARESIETHSLEEGISKSEIISLASPSSVSCGVANSQFTLIPKAIFREAELENFLEFNLGKEKNSSSFFNEIMSKSLVVGYRIPKETENLLIKRFPQIQFIHQAAVLIQSWTPGLHVNFNDSHTFQLAYIEKDNLLFYNQYKVENEEESMYFLGLVAEKLNLDLQKVKIGISGNLEKNGSILSFWKQFLPIENTTFNEIEKSQVNVVSTHQFFTLHKQFQCV